jgi:hypothetical protein
LIKQTNQSVKFSTDSNCINTIQIIIITNKQKTKIIINKKWKQLITCMKKLCIFISIVLSLSVYFGKFHKLNLHNFCNFLQNRQTNKMQILMKSSNHRGGEREMETFDSISIIRTILFFNNKYCLLRVRPTIMVMGFMNFNIHLGSVH